MGGIKPEQFDYLAAVESADANGFDWGGLFRSTQDPGFAQLSPEQQEHIGNLLQVKIAKQQGVKAQPYSTTGIQGGLRRVGRLARSFLPMVGGPGMGGRPGGGPAGLIDAFSMGREASAEYQQQGMSPEQARAKAQQDMTDAGAAVARQFAHYASGGLVDAPAEMNDPFAERMMEERVRPITGIAAIGAQLYTGSALIGWLSKVPLVAQRTANLSAVTKGMIKGATLDFGINAAYPEGIPKEDRIGISDDIARILAPENVENENGLAGRAIAGVGGMVEGALLGSLLYGIGYGVKVADSKYAFTMTNKQLDNITKSLEAAGVDVTGMGKRDIWMTYRTRMSEFVQSLDEATFGGERLSAEAWLAQAFLADPNITELTVAEGRVLQRVFSSNRGGVSVLKGVENPTQAIDKLKNMGIDVDATIIPRKVNPGPAPKVSASVAPSGKAKAPKAKKPTRAELQQKLVETERRANAAERAAQMDKLTGLHNQSAWEGARGRVDADPNLEVVAMDLSNIKGVNDLVGHKAGDEVLKKVGAALQTAVKDIPGAQGFRVGGDEFVVYVPKGQGAATLKTAQDLVGSIKVGDSDLYVTLRGGIGETYQIADEAERAAKALSKQKSYRPPATAGTKKATQAYDLVLNKDPKISDTHAKYIFDQVSQGRTELVGEESIAMRTALILRIRGHIVAPDDIKKVFKHVRDLGNQFKDEEQFMSAIQGYIEGVAKGGKL